MVYTYKGSTLWVHHKTVSWERSQGLKDSLPDRTVYLYNKGKRSIMKWVLV